MDSTTFTDPAVVGFSEKMVFASVNGLVDSSLEQSLGISGHPTTILFTPDGKEVDRLLGYFPADSFLIEMNNFLAGINTLDDYLKRAAKAPNDPKLQYALAEKYTARKKYDEARGYYRRVIELDTNRATLADDGTFSLAYLDYREKKYAEAIKGFLALVKKYPQSDLLEDAEIYIPYIYSKSGDSIKALEYYKKFLAKYPGSEEVEWVSGQIQKIVNPEETK